MNIQVLLKLIRLLGENKEIVLNGNKFFSKNTYTIIKCLVNGGKVNDSEMTIEQKMFVVKMFIDLQLGFNKHTPNFILENYECIKSALNADINSIKYINEDVLDEDLEEYIISEVLNKKFVLASDSLTFFCRQFEIAKNSIELDVKTADYIDWLEFSEDERDILIKLLIDKNYILHSKSHMFLRNNVDIVMCSIKENINNINYASELMKDEGCVFKYLLENGYEFSKTEIMEKPLSYYTDPKILRIALSKLEVYNSNNKKYQERVLKIFNDIINSELKIKDFDEVFRYNSEELWDIEKRENMHMYNNIFAKICAELRNLETFQLVINSLDFLPEMEAVLKDKYYELLAAMKEYYRISHSDINNKLDVLEPYKNEIARLSALYISKSKDGFINEGLQVMREFLYSYFDLDLNNPEIYKKLILSKQMELFKNEYKKEGSEIWGFVEKIIDEYKDSDDYQLVRSLIRNFIIDNDKNISFIIPVPRNYKDYVRFKEASKLINRLNSGYIKYDSCEVNNYHDIIIYDWTEKKYKYVGMMFNNEIFKEYERKMLLYKNLKKRIMFRVKEIKLLDEIDEEIISVLADEVDFDDRYFKYGKNKTLEMICLNDLIFMMHSNEINSKIILDDNKYDVIYDMLVNKRLIWCFLMGGSMFYRGCDELNLDDDEMLKLINKLDELMKLADNFEFDMRKIKDIWRVYEISNFATDSDLAVLGNDIINKLCKDLGFTSGKKDTIIMIAKALICKMVERNKSTVPYVSGKHLNYCYSCYDSQDNSILTAGIDTDACFRVDGVDNDFLHYCALDKNGVVIKITDEFGNFVARAAGFRNGNCVFFNQLRTIYDQHGNEYLNDYDNESKEIIETFKAACRDIVETSQNNVEETTKIDHVFVTKSYCLSGMCSNVSDEVEEFIGDEPVENESEDWVHFVTNTANLEMNSVYNMLGTDYGMYPILCMASIKEPSTLECEDIRMGDVPALYLRKRNKIRISDKIDEDVLRKINKTKAIVYNGMKIHFQPIEISDDSLVVYGDNWYIIYNDGEFMDGCLMVSDDAAVREIQASLEVIEKIYCGKQMAPLNILENVIESKLVRILKND